MDKQEQSQPHVSLWQKAQNWLRGLGGKAPQPEQEEDWRNPCCGQPNVHIAYRGKSDDRMYMAYDRQWQEVRYFQKYGLRVFCAVCRRRLL